MKLTIFVRKRSSINNVHRTLLIPFELGRRKTLGRHEYYEQGAEHHGEPRQPKRDEQQPSESYPERTVGVLHQFFFAHARVRGFRAIGHFQLVQLVILVAIAFRRFLSALFHEFFHRTVFFFQRHFPRLAGKRFF